MGTKRDNTLALRKTSIRTLTTTELQVVNGGGSSNCSSNCHTATAAQRKAGGVQ
jgi:hypothetical protein